MKGSYVEFDYRGHSRRRPCLRSFRSQSFFPICACCHTSTGHRRAFDRPDSRRRRPAFGSPLSHGDSRMATGAGRCRCCTVPEEPAPRINTFSAFDVRRKGLSESTSADRAGDRWMQEKSKDHQSCPCGEHADPDNNARPRRYDWYGCSPA